MFEYQVQKLADLAFYSEGPAVGSADEWFVTTLSGRQILRVFRDGKTAVWAPGDCPNGQVILSSGEHLVCESRSGRIATYRADGSFAGYIINGTCGGIPVQTPNDLLVDSSGNLYFTDSIRSDGKVFFRGSDGIEKCVADGIDYANGIALNRGETRLYVAESYANRIRVYDLAAPGEPEPGYSCIGLPAHSSLDPACNLPDGLAVDREGRLWVAHYGMQAIQIISAESTWLFSIDTELPLTSNLAFITDTPSRKQLLVTGGYGEPGPGAVMQITVLISQKSFPFTVN
ncbi:SMP-30/gluconolactonase/LRE family protein [Dyadobacter aurulentus]|uniref:SMP-30/gluconolactonase/LRE family protein n=1 Tax=Dyadobacter sp. UC 10 TaxID=2605428 RepID=UPI0011F0F214|nr:SMP-30/gluconolactonase/LRE family protein [Dyadobacter sp. UC 10]KAA0988814.1 SMP-30/gluconolactonase/LRE family protein [Dyadobacter sp. UC 10]